MPFLFAHGINRFSHNIAYVILVQLNLFITLFVITLFVITRFGYNTDQGWTPND